jgi:chromosome segregation ATPase
MAPRTCAVCGCDISHRWRSTLYCSNKCTDEAAIARGTKTRGRKKREAAEARCAELDEENKSLKIADAHHFDEYAELKAERDELQGRLEGARLACAKMEARIVVAEEALDQVTALTAENAVLLEAIISTLALVDSIAVSRDAVRELLRPALSTPSPKAMRIMEVVRCAEAWKAEYEKPDDQPADAISMRLNLWTAAIIAYRAALTKGEKE